MEEAIADGSQQLASGFKFEVGLLSENGEKSLTETRRPETADGVSQLKKRFTNILLAGREVRGKIGVRVRRQIFKNRSMLLGPVREALAKRFGLEAGARSVETLWGKGTGKRNFRFLILISDLPALPTGIGMGWRIMEME